MKTFYLLFVAFLIASCDCTGDNDNNNCLTFEPAGIEEVTEKSNVDAAGTLFDVAFRVKNGCGSFGSIEQTTEGMVTTIEVIAKYEGCVCPEISPLLETVYIFNQTTPGTYTLQFKKSDGTYISQTVVVPE